MSILVAALSTPLAAQSRNAWTFGFAGTLGGGWQVEGADVGYVHGAHIGPVRAASVSARLASFVDEGAIIGGVRGFVFGLSVGGRTGLWQLAEIGSETSPSPLGLDLTVEATGYAATRSPLLQGSPWAAISVLPGVRFGAPDGVQYRLMVGPTVFLGRAPSDLRGFLGLRFELPLARPEPHP